MLDELLQSLTPSELMFIAECDYGVDADIHFEELKKLVAGPSHHLTEGLYWHPYEVIELCANSLKPGHEREFVTCTLLVLRAVASGYDTSTNLDLKLAERAQDYDVLPAPYREAILDAYLRLGANGH
ncbi:hypothetical protein CSC70_09465 [Pseudoxanthomonas kalamensis DSM 18571]|uniref:hypothetical protein n=1 Tax=Pseudoxanthomonas kalamensis TaxID=289483 RepID=UPI00139091D3|nr:hypothetical protein [Pseudoxanthomonas kalamensis]KAF1709910.1 hypothetical protein CSC70_09465 [Pseudoxanthomonas kalamensis DSM 18571]